MKNLRYVLIKEHTKGHTQLESVRKWHLISGWKLSSSLVLTTVLKLNQFMASYLFLWFDSLAETEETILSVMFSHNRIMIIAESHTDQEKFQLGLF